MSEIVAILALIALLFHFIICARELDLPAKAAFVLLPLGLVLQMSAAPAPVVESVRLASAAPESA